MKQSVETTPHKKNTKIHTTQDRQRSVGTAPKKYKGKKVLIFGLGLNDGGLGMTQFFLKHGADVTVTDGKTAEQLESTIAQLLKYKNIKYSLGGHKKEDFLSNEIIIQNPAIKPTNEWIQLAEQAGKTVEMEMSLFHKLSPCPIIGITGTRGKSTTTTLIYKILQKWANYCPLPYKQAEPNKRGTSNKSDNYGNPVISIKSARVLLGGNIGKSAIRELHKLKNTDLAVLELSSFQLHTMGKAKVAPHIAVVTNMSTDHLNWHIDMQDYVNTKANIFINQTKDDYVVLNQDNSITRDFIQLAKTTPLKDGQYRKADKLITISLEDPKATYYLDSKLTVFERGYKLMSLTNAKLKGHHNLYNILSAIAVCRIPIAPFGKATPETIAPVLKIFKGVKGRQELIRTKQGIHFINDTTATSVEAMIANLNRFGPEFTRRLVLISGGVDKGLDYTLIKPLIEKYVATVVLLDGTASQKLKALLAPKKVEILAYFNNFKTAIQTAYKSAIKGQDKTTPIRKWAVILCPGGASFNMFKNEFDRGDQFDSIVRGL